jgi:hypothetical protein
MPKTRNLPILNTNARYKPNPSAKTYPGLI